MIRERLVQAFFYNNPDNYPPIVNGIRLLTRAGWKVELYCRDDGKRWNVSYPDGAQVERVSPISGSTWRNYFHFLTEVVRRGGVRANVFLGHDMHGLLPARLLASRYRRPLIYHCHDFSEPTGEAEALGGRIVRVFERRFARTASLVVIPDADRANVISRQLRLKSPPLVVANAPLTRTSGSGSALRQALAKSGRQFEKIVLRQGRIGVGHGIEKTIHSIPYWASKEWGFVLMGIADTSYVQSLTDQAKTLGVERQFITLPAVGYDQVCDFTPGASLGHALYDPFHINNIHIATASNKIMEYMEAGLPLLVSNSRGLRTLIHQYNCGLTADETSPESIAKAINTLLSDSDLAQRMGRASREAFDNHFCYERQFTPVINWINGQSSSRPDSAY
jgi:glycosyltransferase involved in cell wall biosynthesis